MATLFLSIFIETTIGTSGDRLSTPLRVILSGGLKANFRWQAEVEVLRLRSKTEERSDEGIYERLPIAFHRKLTSLEKDIKSL